MVDKLVLYISASPDLRLERATLSRAVTEIPTSLGWSIKQTPAADGQPDLDAVARANVHLLIIGSDIQAPVGLEWLTAKRAGKSVRLFHKTSVMQTQSAQAFIRELERHATWQRFADAADLRAKALKRLVEHLLSNTVTYEIAAEEVDRLRTWRKQIDAERKRNAIDDRRGGADQSGVILTTSPERFVPSGGKLIDGSNG
jgi:hypothetical protein